MKDNTPVRKLDMDHTYKPSPHVSGVCICGRVESDSIHIKPKGK